MPQVEYCGCRAVSLPGPVCTLSAKNPLQLWVRTEPGLNVEIRVGNRHLKAVAKEARGGWSYSLSLPQEDSQLTVRLRRPDGAQGPPWSLSLTPAEVPAWEKQIKALDEQGKQEEILRLLEQLRKEPPPKEKGIVLRMLAFTHSGDHQAYARYLEQGIKADRAEGCLSCEVDKVTWLAKYDVEHGHFGEARQRLDQMALRLPAEAPAEARYHVAYYRGLLGDAVGDYRSALEQLGKADDLATRLGMSTYRWDARQVKARILQDLGRSGEASALFNELLADPSPSNPCDLGSLLTNLGWSRLRARDAGGAADDPMPTLQRALTEFENNSCPSEKRLNAHLNLAFAYQQENRWTDSRREIAAALRLGTPNLNDLLWWDDLEARAAIAEDHPQYALELYEELARKADLALSPDGRLRAALGLAKARLALGQRAAALDAFAEADRQIDEQIWWIPAQEGRDTFVAQRETITRLYLETLLEEGQTKRAFEVARRARSRLLRQLTIQDRLALLTVEERQNWEPALSRFQKLREDFDNRAANEWTVPGDQQPYAREEQAAQLVKAKDELDRVLASLGDPGEGALSPPSPGEVILAYHSLRKGWVGFAATQRGVEVTYFDLYNVKLLSPRDGAHRLLAPFHRAIGSAERVRVLPYGPLREVDFHSLPFDGEPLLARHVVVYSLDLPVRSSPAPSALPSGRQALVVADPVTDRGDLPEAREEGEVVAAAIGGWGSGWSCKRLDGRKAGAEAVRFELPGVSLFHFAGHGVFAGFSGWDSLLPLTGGDLTLGDVLTLQPRAPAWVVLSACDGGRTSQEAPGEGIGLANAFLLAGSRAVIAANRPVADTAARGLMRELYRGWRPGEDLAHQLRRAQLARNKQGSPRSVWGAFRVLVP
jgi:tetratricopeptide (TPR) repeat protein